MAGQGTLMVIDDTGTAACVWRPGTSTFSVHAVDREGTGLYVGRRTHAFVAHGDHGRAPTVEQAARLMFERAADWRRQV